MVAVFVWESWPSLRHTPTSFPRGGMAELSQMPAPTLAKHSSSVGCFTNVTPSTPDCRPRKWGYHSPFVDEETEAQGSVLAETTPSWDSEPGPPVCVLSR